MNFEDAYKKLRDGTATDEEAALFWIILSFPIPASVRRKWILSKRPERFLTKKR